MVERSIEDWCEEFNLSNYNINDNGTVDVHDGVNLTLRGLYKMPIQFGVVYGYFNCNHNSLSSLEGSPVKLGGGFLCGSNNLITLDGLNILRVNEYFYCSNNQLISLKGCPMYVEGDFNCSTNNLTTLEYGPEEVTGTFWCNYNSNLTYDKRFVKKYGAFSSDDESMMRSIKLYMLMEYNI
jgi:hypothetical protein